MKKLLKAGVLLGLGLGLPPQALAPEWDPWGDRLIKVIQSLDVVARAYFGCPIKGSFEVGECRKAYGRLDYMLVHAAREEAKEFFDLEDRKR